MSYVPVIGLEIHIQAKTKTKMFSAVSAEYFGAAPNTLVDPVTLGLPGALPVPNKKAIELCIKLALGLGCEVNRDTKFDRKNYFYPDLPKGYQISQYDKPIGFDGNLSVDEDLAIRIRRVHMEEDTGKSVHQADKTLIDLNKAGVPLIEVVTEPDFKSKDEVTRFAKRLKHVVSYLSVSDANMEKGQMRFELNISLKQKDAKELPNYKVEVKNIGSISLLSKVIDFEIKRQSEILSSGKTPIQETRGAKDMTGETLSQRIKETAEDYRYFPEPDIPPIKISDAWLTEIKNTIVELPTKRKARFINEFKLSGDLAELLVDEKLFGDFVEEIFTKEASDQIKLKAVNIFLTDVLGILEKNNLEFKSSIITANDLLSIAEKQLNDELNNAKAKEIIEKVILESKKIEDLLKDNSFSQISDDSELKTLCEKAISENPEIVSNIAKNPNAIKALIGKVMALSKGRANPVLVESILKDLLK